VAVSLVSSCIGLCVHQFGVAALFLGSIVVHCSCNVWVVSDWTTDSPWLSRLFVSYGKRSRSWYLESLVLCSFTSFYKWSCSFCNEVCMRH
jgi:hypothetical protein